MNDGNIDNLSLLDNLEITDPQIKEQLDDLCTSSELSLTALQEILNRLDKNGSISNYTFDRIEGSCLHKACMNYEDVVTLDIIQLLLETFPTAGGWQMQTSVQTSEEMVYPLHVACCNSSLSSSIIELLVKNAPETLEHITSAVERFYDLDERDDCARGLPLHFYLAEQRDVNIDIVKMMVEAYPQALVTADEDWACYPIHVALFNEYCGLEVIEYLLEYEPSSIRLLDAYGRSPFHSSCRYRCGVNHLEVVQLLFAKWPEAIQQRDTWNDWLPIHDISYDSGDLCEDTSLGILRLMLDFDSTLPMERADNPGTEDDEYLPIHFAARFQSFACCKLLIDACPETVKIVTNNNALPIHEACKGRSAEIIQYLLDLYPEGCNAHSLDGVSYRFEERGITDELLPIHRAAIKDCFARPEVIELLLKHDPALASKETTQHRCLPLHFACHIHGGIRDDSTTLEAITLLYDAYPEALWARDNHGRTPFDFVKSLLNPHKAVEDFFKEQLTYAKKAQYLSTLTALDDGWKVGAIPYNRHCETMLPWIYQAINGGSCHYSRS